MADGYSLGTAVALRQEHTRGGGSCPVLIPVEALLPPELLRRALGRRHHRAPANCLHPFGVGNCEPVFFTIQELHVMAVTLELWGHESRHEHDAP